MSSVPTVVLVKDDTEMRVNRDDAADWKEKGWASKGEKKPAAKKKVAKKKKEESGE